MQINNTGHVVNNEGITTKPHISTWWVGCDAYRVAFDYLALDNDKVALHAVYGNTLRQMSFRIFYDVVDSSKALASAKNLVNAACLLLQAHNSETEIDSDRTNDFLSAVASAIVKRKRLGLYVVAS